MTSNIGAKMIGKRTHLGFHRESAEQQHENTKARVLDEAKRVFDPEFTNRVDEIVMFHALSAEHLRDIVDTMLRDLNRQLHQQHVTIRLSPEAHAWLAQKGYDPVYGARPLRRLMRKSIEDLLAEALLSGRLRETQAVRMIVEPDGTLGYEPLPADDAIPAELAELLHDSI